MKRVPVFTCFVVSFLTLLTGCFGDGNIGTVTGKVTLDGKALKGAYIEFQPVEGNRPSSAVTDDLGNYELLYMQGQNGAEVGKHLIRIDLEIIKEDDQGKEIILPNKVPEMYNENSNLYREVKPGANVINFELTTK